MTYIHRQCPSFNIPRSKYRTGTNEIRTSAQRLLDGLHRNEVLNRVEQQTLLFSVPLTRFEITADPAGAINRVQQAIDILNDAGEARA